MNALVIGYGSIGQRHVRVLEELGLDVSVVSRRNIEYSKVYRNLLEAFKQSTYDYIVIANETNLHSVTLREIIKSDFTGTILIEKPLFSKKEIVELNSSKVFVAYNLRFHPLVQQLKKLLNDEQVVSVNAYVGQYLPSWRPNIDYRNCYSAFSEKGGGVLRDLSHELDYLMMLFGDWQSLYAISDKISELQIHSEDYVQVSYKTEKDVYVSVELNYLDRITQRYVTIQTNNSTIKVDFINNTINCNGEIEVLESISRDYTYMKQHEAVLSESLFCCTFEEGLKVVKMIEAIEKSSSMKESIYND